MPVAQEELIEELNKDLKLEYMALVQYAQHAGVMRGAAFMTIRRLLETHAREELQHALTLAAQIDLLGGVPTVKVLKARTSPEPLTMLKQDLAGEETAIRRYRLRISQAEELGLYDLAQKLREILAMEQDHLRHLREALG